MSELIFGPVLAPVKESAWSFQFSMLWLLVRAK